MSTTITAAELREGDVVGMHGDTRFTVERVQHRDAQYHEVVWENTNLGQPYAYMGDESWPLISRRTTPQPASALVTVTLPQNVWQVLEDHIAASVDDIPELRTAWLTLRGEQDLADDTCSTCLTRIAERDGIFYHIEPHGLAQHIARPSTTLQNGS